jgi:hypothetical protein
MNTAIGPGAIVIAVIFADGCVRSVHVRSTRPIGLARVFLGRLASLFDPCVAFSVDCKEAEHA